MQPAVPRPGMESVPPAVEMQCPNHWAAREVPVITLMDFEEQVCCLDASVFRLLDKRSLTTVSEAGQ